VNSWRKFRHLAQQERIQLIQAAILMPLVSVSLRMLGWQCLMKLLARLGQSNKEVQPRQQTLDQAQRVAYVTHAAASHGLIRATCLERSMVLWWLLLRQGIKSQLVLAGRTEQSTFQAHAWVEYENVVLNDRPDVRQDFNVFEKR
jgi:hypothetical protein